MFDIEKKVDTEVKKVNECIRYHKPETNKIINDHETRIYDNEKDIFARGNNIYDIELKCNDLEQYARRNSIRIHGMPEKAWVLVLKTRRSLYLTSYIISWSLKLI